MSNFGYFLGVLILFPLGGELATYYRVISMVRSGICKVNPHEATLAIRGTRSPPSTLQFPSARLVPELRSRLEHTIWCIVEFLAPTAQVAREICELCQ